MKFHFKAEKKLIAAEQAHRLLQQFDRDISATEGSTFCKLAALLNDTPKANFHHPCRTVFNFPLRSDFLGFKIFPLKSFEMRL